MNAAAELKKRRAECVEKVKELNASAEDRDWTEKESAKFHELEAEIGKIDGELKAAEEAREARERAVRLAESKAPGHHGPRTSNGTSNSNGTAHYEIDAKVGKDRVIDDPKKGFKSPRQFVLDVMRAGQTGEVSENLRRMQATAGSDEQMTISDPYGGFLVPEGLAPGILMIEPEPDPMGGMTRRVPMGAPRVSFNARVDKNHSSSVSGGLTVSRKLETAAGSTSRMEFEQVTLNAHTLFGAAYATEEILTDSPQSFASVIAAGFGDEFNSKLIDERINGTGVGEYLGIMNAPAAITIAAESGPQTADTIVAANVLKMRARAWRYNQCVWMANHDTLIQLVGVHNTGSNSDTFLFTPGNGTDKPDTLLGRPIIFTEYCATLGDAGDLLLVNWNEYLEGTYQPMQSAESIHVRFLNNERTFKFWMRNDGAPWWSAALTPKNSTSTLSPYVILGARTGS